MTDTSPATRHGSFLQRRVGAALLALTAGGLFGGVAAWAYRTRPHRASANAWGVFVTLTSGTWLWGVLTVLVAWALVRRSSLKGWRRWVWAWTLALLFLSATTLAWYGPAQTLPALPLVLAICLPITAGTAFVSAFLTHPGPIGLVARLCLPLGLTTIIVAASHVGPLQYGQIGLGVMWSAALVGAVDARAHLPRRSQLRN